MYFSVGRESFNFQWLIRPAREFLSPATSLLAVIEMGLVRELIIIKQNHHQHVTAILLRESQISYSRQIVTSGVTF